MKSKNAFAGKRILLVNTGSLRKRFILQILRSYDVHLTVLSAEVNWAKPYVDQWILADPTDHKKALQAVLTHYADAENQQPEGVLTFWEDDVLLTAKLTDHFALTGISYQQALNVRNKSLFRSFCRDNDLPAPGSALVRSDQELIDAAKLLSFPLVIKPVFGASSAYVTKVDERSALPEAYAYIRSNISTEAESALHESTDLMLEEFISGDEVDIDLVLQNGKVKFACISDNDTTGYPYFMEDSGYVPSMLPGSDQTALLEMAEVTLEKLGIQNGIIHFEAKNTTAGGMPLEINIRMGGDQHHALIKGAWGVDLVRCAVMAALGQYIAPVKNLPEPKKYLACKYFLSDHSGIISKLALPETFAKELSVEEFYFAKKVGDAVYAPPVGFDSLGWITVSGKNMPEAETRLKAAYKLIDYEISKFKTGSFIGKTLRRSAGSEAVPHKNQLFGAEKIANLRKITPADYSNLKIGVACNTYQDSEGDAVDSELAAVGNNIATTLRERNYEVSFIDFNSPDQAIKNIRKNSYDLIFNVCERINNSSLLEPHAASILDICQVPYTGSNPFTLGLCIDKIRVKKLLSYHQVPLPKWDYCYSTDDPLRDDLRFPVIVKPSNTDNSIGITNDSVVTNQAQMKQQIDYVINTLKRPVIVEEFIEGDEYDVSIIGSNYENLKVLPLSRSVFDRMPEGYWSIYPFESKYGETDIYKKGISVQRPPKNISKNLSSLISEIALDTYSILGCSDYGRVEIRVDKNNNPFVLELNPNPSINIGDCLPSVAKLINLDYGDFLEMIIDSTIKRYRNKPPYFHLQSNIF